MLKGVMATQSNQKVIKGYVLKQVQILNFTKHLNLFLLTVINDDFSHFCLFYTILWKTAHILLI